MISRSAQVLAARRALAYQQKSPIFQDPYASIFVNDEVMAFAKETDSSIHYVLLRHRIIDDLLIQYKGIIEQVLVLGAGFDTRFQRFNFPVSLDYLEVDSPSLFKFKEAQLDKYQLKVPSFKPLMITTMDEWSDLLSSTDRNKLTLIIGEGFFMYHSKKNVFDMLRKAVTYYAENPIILFDMVDPICSQEEQQVHDRLKKDGETILSLIPSEEIERFFHGLTMDTSVYTPSFLTEKYLQKKWAKLDDRYVICASSSEYVS